MTVSEQRGSDQASKRTESPQKKTDADKKSGASEAVEVSSEEISRLLLQIHEFLTELLPRSETVGEEDLTAEDLESYAKVRAFLSGRREGNVGAVMDNLEDALNVIADARDEIDAYLESIENDHERHPERRRSARRMTARR